MVSKAQIPIVGFIAYGSNTGKTTLLTKLLPILKEKGLRVGVIKHVHHRFDIDTPGKDSYRFRQAGADQVLVASSQRWVLMVETGKSDDPYLDQVLPNIHQSELDLIVVEGFKHETFPKIEVHRPSLGNPLLFPQDEAIIAVATDAPLPIETNLPLLDLNEPYRVFEFICQQFNLD